MVLIKIYQRFRITESSYGNLKRSVSKKVYNRFFLKTKLKQNIIFSVWCRLLHVVITLHHLTVWNYPFPFLAENVISCPRHCCTSLVGYNGIYVQLHFLYIPNNNFVLHADILFWNSIKMRRNFNIVRW